MKTAMQELKMQLESKVNDPMCIQIESDIFKRVSNLVDIYLSKEKQQIVEAYHKGYQHYAPCYRINDAEKYYNENYNDNETKKSH